MKIAVNTITIGIRSI